MPTIHPSAILTGDITLAEDVTIGPHCSLTGPLTVGAGTRLLGHNYLTGPCTLGENNILYPFVSLGFSPQDISCDHDHPGPGLIIGSDNVFREQVTIHRASHTEQPTRVGNHNYLMVGSHLGHDVWVGDHCVFVNNVAVGGHVRVDDRVIIGGGTAIHQFCRLGRGSFLSGCISISKNLPPWFTLTSHNCARTLNMVGMRRNKLSTDEIAVVKWVFKTLYRSELNLSAAIKALEERKGQPMVKEYLDFIASSDRGIVGGQPDPRR